jgi:hypothetical protein
VPGGPFDGAGYAGRCAAADSDDAIAREFSIPAFHFIRMCWVAVRCARVLRVV